MAVIYAKTALGGVEFRVVQHAKYVSIQSRNCAKSARYKERGRVTNAEFERFAENEGYDWRNNPFSICYFVGELSMPPGI